MGGALALNKSAEIDPRAGHEAAPCITQCFLDRVRSQPDREVFHYKSHGEWKAVTWKEYYAFTRSISLGLIALGVKPGDRVSILANTSLEWAATEMAVMGARGVSVPLYPSLNAAECAYILRHCEARFLVVEDEAQLQKILAIKKDLPDLRKIVIIRPKDALEVSRDQMTLSLAELCLQGDVSASVSTEEVFERNLEGTHPAEVFTICYTSGTTGVPKGVVLTHANINSVRDDLEKVLGPPMGEGTDVLTFLPFSHIAGRTECHAAYYLGWRVYYAESVEKVFLNMSEVRPHFIFAVPRIFEKAYLLVRASVESGSSLKRGIFKWAVDAGRDYYRAMAGGGKPSLAQKAKFGAARKLVLNQIYQRFGGRLRFCISGGAPLSVEVAEFMRIVGIPIVEGYGLTETGGPIVLNRIDAPVFGSIGPPLPEVAIKIDEDGEILVQSRKVFREYYKNPEATREAIDVEGWFHTGDIGAIDENGFVKITDRKKDLIVTSGGKKVAPQKIEGMAALHNEISHLVLFGDRRPYLTALVVPNKSEIIRFALRHNIIYSEYRELVRHPKVVAALQGVIDKINGDLSGFETIKKFTILPVEFSIATGELTPSMKVRRRNCVEKFRGELEQMYDRES